MTVIFGIPKEQKNPKYNCVTWYHVIYFIPLAAPIPNTVIQSSHVRIFQYPSQYGMLSSYQNYIITMSKGYLNQFYGAYDVPHESMNLPIGNLRRRLSTETHPYQVLASKTTPVSLIMFSDHGCVLIQEIHGMLKSPLM